MTQITCRCKTVGKALNEEKRTAIGNECDCAIDDLVAKDCRVYLEEE